MGIAEKLGDPTWLFDLGFPVSRFDVTLSKTGLLDDLTWELGERYELPDLVSLSDPEIPMRLRAAWHERGLFFQMEIPDQQNQKPNSPSPSHSAEGPKPLIIYRIFLNTRHAPGIQRANSHCVHFLGHSFVPTKDKPLYSISFRIAAIARSKDQSPAVGTPMGCGEVALINGAMTRSKIFIPAHGLFGYSPIVFPDLSMHFSCHRPNENELHVARSSRMPVHENPSLWSHAKLID
ncbi:hypothetical protein VN12_04745 [Pirellula sp. SH-Sr6A]|uniref:hypothetical protein n=1 Tax=Pirellula sp. SH-Sr6A TaxID=1632865 RepID=UPI00078BD5E3|nr:hypothetical protein [Pirellula sp. SH-Sr6A]AMV31403.1 hypothetical protein VN12_04745 [Pirellula sp. SH-Sr6A]